MLTTDRSLDERYLWSGLKRERKMKRLVRKLADASLEKERRQALAVNGEAPSAIDTGEPPA